MRAVRQKTGDREANFSRGYHRQSFFFSCTIGVLEEEPEWEGEDSRFCTYAKNTAIKPGEFYEDMGMKIATESIGPAIAFAPYGRERR